MKAIVGDSSDNITGVKGYKRQKALKVYKDASFLELHKETITHNEALLRFKDDLDVTPRPIDLSKENLTNIFSNLNSSSLLKRINKLAR